jgi:hypothetical protein
MSDQESGLALQCCRIYLVLVKARRTVFYELVSCSASLARREVFLDNLYRFETKPPRGLVSADKDPVDILSIQRTSILTLKVEDLQRLSDLPEIIRCRSYFDH